MKSASRHLLLMGGLALSLAFAFATPSSAQNREKYLISAKAGGVNSVTGNVKVLRKGEERQQVLTDTDDLQSGDIVSTGIYGRVEVLLNPGSYMRVGENTEFELTDASLDHLLVRLVKGSIVIEAAGGDGVELAIGVNTPQTEAVIVKGGIYRFNALANETTEIIVRKGRLLYGRGAGTELKGGRKVIISRGGVEVAKLNKKDEDALDLWSKERAEFLARANRRLERDTLLASFDGFDWGAWNNTYDRTNRRDRHGFWVYNPSTRDYCYLPVGGRGGSSPYGHNYGNGLGGNGRGHNWPRGGDDGERWSGRGRHGGGSGSSDGGSSGGSTGSSDGGSSGSTGGGGGRESRGDSQPAPAPAPAPDPPQVSAPSPPPPPPPAPSNDGDRQIQREDNSRPNR